MNKQIKKGPINPTVKTYLSLIILAILLININLFIKAKKEYDQIKNVIDTIEQRLLDDIETHKEEIRDLQAQLSWERYCSLELVECGLGD